MPGVGTSAALAGRSLRIAVVALAITLVGASPNPMPIMAKADRASTPADCRSDRFAETVDCLGVVLPSTIGEVVEVAPGLSVVSQVGN